jgi:hypothetical protein
MPKSPAPKAAKPAADKHRKKLPPSKPASNPYVSDHAKHLDRGPKYGASGSRRPK